MIDSPCSGESIHTDRNRLTQTISTPTGGSMRRIVVLGSLNVDLVITVERLPRGGETLAGGDLAVFEGGKGANQACAAGRLGGAVTMIGQVGTDPFAARLIEALRAAGVNTSGIGISDRPTG